MYMFLIICVKNLIYTLQASTLFTEWNLKCECEENQQDVRLLKIVATLISKKVILLPVM